MLKKCSACGKENIETAEYCEGCGGDLPSGSVKLLNNRYQILETVKSGGMGCVFRARDTRLDSVAAIKKMSPFYKDSEEKKYAEQRFLDEAKILSRLHHSGLPKVIDYFTEEDPNTKESSQYLVMTFIEGKDLETLLKQKWNLHPPIEVVLDYFRQILEILSYLHSQNPPVIYRDMKPSNIMIHFDSVAGGRQKHPYGSVFLVDFGIARTFDPESTGTMIGTPGYAAPEQYQGFTEPRSDIYSLGVVIHFMLTGLNPADGSRPPFTFDPVDKFNKKSPKYLNEIISAMLDLVAGKRPESADAILDALDRQSGPARQHSPFRAHKPLKQRSSPGQGPDGISETGQENENQSLQATQAIKRNASEGQNRQTSENPALIRYNEEEKPDYMPEFYSAQNVQQPIPPPPPAYYPEYGDEFQIGAKNQVKPALPVGFLAILVILALFSGLYAFSSDFRKFSAELFDPGDKSGIPLHQAAYKGDLKKAIQLISDGASMDEYDGEGVTAYHKAIKKGRLDIVRFFIDRGVDVNQATKYGARPLYMAAKRGDTEMVKLLLSYNADPNLKDINDVRAIHGAVESNNYEIVELLIKAGANANVANRTGDTPLIIARRNNNREIEKILLSNGAR
ncbi:MAG: ankyrin repeat domain-containing protein [Firmicutes bacterium]|nr:ankyrin repeat domain-containing protein [Bacillota bacterium]